MAGRPKTKARAAIRLLEQADILAAQTFFSSPVRDAGETKKAPGPSHTQKLWDQAIEMTMRASNELERLAQALASKAGMDRPVSMWTPGDTPDVTLEQMTTMAKKAGVTPPSMAEVEAIHRSREEARAAALARAQEEAELAQEEWDGGGEDDDDFDEAEAEDDAFWDDEEEEDGPDLVAVPAVEQPSG